ncbi:Rieske (2Fe-2S) protein [bacterium]|nr:Rieske (2Fe-2S) protein [bacterium]
MSTSDFIYACLKKDIPMNAAKNVRVAGLEIAIFHTAEGYVARSGVCKHNAFKLELCDVSGDIVSCPRHGWRYRISNGKGVKPSWTQLDIYALEIRDEEIWVQAIADQSNQDDFDTSAFDW